MHQDRLARIETLLYVIARDVRTLRRQVADGNGSPSLLARVAKVEERATLNKKTSGAIAAGLTALAALIGVFA